MLSGTPGPDGDSNDQICEVDLGQPILTAGNFEDGAIGNGFGAVDVDLYPIAITRTGIEHTFTADNRAGSGVDTYLRLFNASGVELADDDDSGTSNNGPGDNAEINFTFTTAGTYYLGVSAAGNTGYDVNTGTGDSTGNSTGAFRLTFEDNNDEIDEASTSLLDGFASSSIDPDTDVDLYRFDAVGGQTFDIEVDGSNGLDAFLVIFDDNGNQLAADDDSGPGFDSKLRATFPTTADYYIGVSNTGNRNYDVTDGTGDTAGSATGTYTITATEVSLDPDDRISNSTNLGNLFTGGTRTDSGVIDTDTDVDLYKFEVGRDGSYVEIDIDVPTLGLDSLLRLFDASGTQIALNEDGNASGESGAFPRDSFLLMLLDQGTYYAGVSGADNTTYNPTTGLGDTDGNATGSYTIDIQDRIHVDTNNDIAVTILTQNITNSLREAIDFANGESGSQTITFKPSLFSTPKTITLDAISVGSDQLEITDSVTIDGPGADLLSISGNDNSRVFLIDNGNDSTEIDVTIAGVTIRNGQSSSLISTSAGGGIRNSENLTLENVTVASNTSNFNSTHLDSGGGLFHRRGVLVVTGSTFSGNSGFNGGGIRITSGSAEITNSTFSGNFSRDGGGGVGASGSSTVTVRSSTFTGNRADNDGSSTFNRGGGVFFDSSSPLILHNSIVAGNFTGTGNQASDVVTTASGTVSSSSSHNLIGGSSPGISDGVNGNIEGDGSGGVIPITDILEPVLSDAGGTTLIHRLVVGSPALNAGNNAEIPAGVTTDQRGTGFARIIGGIVDIGAFESQTFVPSADFDTDGDVDGADFLAWQRGFGTASPTPAEGDADFDADVDAADLGIWQTNFGSVAPLLAAASSGPSPVASAALIDAAIALSIESKPIDETLVTAAPNVEGMPVDIAEASLPAASSANAATDLPTSDNLTERGATEVDATKQANEPWLTDELLERVFG